MYEGYGPGGVGILVECATDNLNRTYPEVKNIFNKKGEILPKLGAVAFQFSRKGSIRVSASGDDAILKILDAGAEDAEITMVKYRYTPKPKSLLKVRDTIEICRLNYK